ncbi:MAG: RNA polymerase sigma-70 factor [Tannerellaceae bacterium]|jgi:RNA polymerase sigma-70 factor (ECF subfamily)|nr:RNA polymerase sigma-70 factor [Tannerellaceae bacterium]
MKKHGKEDEGAGRIIFGKLFRAHYADLLRYARRLVASRHAAEDIVQEVFMSVWLRRELIDFSAPIRPYLMRATHHKCLDYLASLAVMQKVSGQDAVGELIDLAAAGDSPYDELLLKEMSDRVERLIASFPARRQAVFRLSRSEQLSNQDTARRLGISVKAVEKHISAALAAIRRCLSTYDL